MTAILEGIRRLDAAHARGELSAIDLAAAKAELINSVPDADEPVRPTPPAHPRPERARAFGIGAALLLGAFVFLICAGVAMFLTRDIMLSFTLAITVLGAATVALFRQADR